MLRYCFTLLILLLLSGCDLSERRINHVVLVWFDEGVTQEQIATIKAETQKLARISQVRFLDTGRPLPSERPIVDDSFDLGVLMQFDSKETMEAYLDDPRHKAFVETHIKGYAKRVLVYDF